MFKTCPGLMQARCPFRDKKGEAAPVDLMRGAGTHGGPVVLVAFLLLE